jgi:tetratricopeptide (TPR) repeat protein
MPVSYAVNFASLLAELHRPAEAMNALADSVARARSAGNVSWTINALLMKGIAQGQLGQFAEATEALEEAASLAARNTRGNHDMLGRIAHRRADIELTRGDLAAARRHSEAALSHLGYPDAQPVRTTGKALVTAGYIELAASQPAEAERLVTASLVILESIARGPETSGDVGEALLLRAKARLALGDPATAQGLLRRAIKCLTNGLDAQHTLTVEAHELLSASGG